MIDTNAKLKFDFQLSELADIRRCLTILYATKEGSQPLDRNFGLSRSYLDKPLPVAQNEYALEVVRKTALYEPRVQVTEVTFEFHSDTGNMIPTIHFTKGEEDE